MRSKLFLPFMGVFLSISVFAQVPDTLWTRTYGDSLADIAYSSQQTKDGGYILAGYTLVSGTTNTDVLLVKASSVGSEVWTKTYGDSLAQYGQSVQQTADNGYIIGGYTQLSQTNTNMLLIKTDSLGNGVWSKTYGDSLLQYCYFVQQTTDKGYILTGYTQLTTNNYDVWLVKTD
jgi:hypothetical protein